MASDGMKSAYEAALERLERQGIEPPSADALDEGVKAEMREVRSKAEAKLAELEILHRDALANADPVERAEAEEKYVEDRRRIESERDRKLRALRGDR